LSTKTREEVGVRQSERIAVIGGGYVGAVTAAVLAHFSHHVALAESDPTRRDLLASGRSPVVEKGLEELLQAGLASGRLRVFDSAIAAVADADYVFLCVPTPQHDDGSADLSAVRHVADEIRGSLREGAVVINKSTVPAGSARLVTELIDRPDVTVVSNPEFLREGSAVADSLNPERIVVGSDDQSVARRVAELFGATNAPLIVTSTITAETIKYAANAFLATKLSFVNAIATLCEAVGADVRDLLVALGYDKRIGFDFLSPGPGWGGSCLPKDTAALISTADASGYDFSMLRAVVAQNAEHLERIVEKVRRVLGGELDGAEVALWGLTFKSNTDDRRASPAVAIARGLIAGGARLTAYDPTVGVGQQHEDLQGITICASPYDACVGARAVVILTEWDEFRGLDFSKVAEVMAEPAIVDARNLLDPTALRAVGFAYEGIGR
jgi:UDPglucose 6-dehydrogenase